MTNNSIEIYQTANGNTEISVKFEQESVWLNLNQMAMLFGRDKSVISRHLKNIFKEEELDKNSVVAFFATTATDGKIYQVEYFNLDAIISVGYRVNSKQGTHFRIWATQRLKEYLVQGYSINQKRLEELKKDYAKHRKLAKVALMNHPELWKTLSINGTSADAYLKVMEDIKTLYTQAKTHEVAKPLLVAFKFTEAIADEQLKKATEVEALRATYEKEKGESQQATKNKDKSFAELDKWVKDFYTVAKIALEDQPQLLESVGKWVRS